MLTCRKTSKNQRQYEQALKDKNREITSEIERIKKNMEYHLQMLLVELWSKREEN